MMVDLPGPRERERASFSIFIENSSDLLLGILRVHLAGENLAEGLDIPFLARRAENYSGSDLKSMYLFSDIISSA
jgi:hypothetical protein